MDKTEAKTILIAELHKYRSMSYADLRGRIGSQVQFSASAPSGTRYQVEVDFFWDDKPDGNIRVIGAIDDGGWRAIVPLTDSFIMSPDGTFLGEAD